MDNKTFNIINKKSLMDFGFEYFNKKFYLVLSNIIIRIQYVTYPFGQGKMMAYDIIIKQLTKSSLNGLCEIENVFEDMTETPVQMPVLKKIEVRVNNDKISNVFICSELDKDFWENALTQKLNEIFNPFKKNDLECMAALVFSADPQEKIIVNDNVQNFLLKYKNLNVKKRNDF